MKHVLRAEGINKFFKIPDVFQVLKDVSFTVDKGEFVSIMGKSGCGKSTLLYISVRWILITRATCFWMKKN